MMTSPSFSGDLRQKLERPLGRPEVRQVEGGVGGDHPDQSHAGEIEAFGDHLRPHEHVRFDRAELADDAHMGAPARGGVPVHSSDSRLGKHPAQFVFDPQRVQTSNARSARPQW